LNQKNLLILAGTGNSEVIAHDTAWCSDSIYWLDKSNNEFEMLFLSEALSAT
jgi:SM-20-related protein